MEGNLIQYNVQLSFPIKLPYLNFMIYCSRYNHHHCIVFTENQNGYDNFISTPFHNSR